MTGILSLRPRFARLGLEEAEMHAHCVLIPYRVCKIFELYILSDSNDKLFREKSFNENNKFIK